MILPPPGMQRRGREAKSDDFAIEKKEGKEEEENTDSEKSDAEVISDENDVNLLDQA